uniref:NADH-ubiquinone oxidoreductase chain 5 n=1 Tax=Cyclosa argenteoalba TaxID=345692 RepID=A0A0K0NTU5_9ARAC|nr:NADH dehydrogenase subunit 5 [Cyclosa argenteoalba]AKN58355.1 NADH dehydrogenase subunit 5 [Cyclosa argenteoalba]
MFPQSLLMLMFSTLPFMTAMLLLFNSTFISLEIPLLSVFSFNLPVSLMIDWTSMMFLFTVMFISSTILLFSVEYIPPSEHKQFSFLLLSFVLSMSLLILSDNIIFMLLGWDGLGLTSFILVIYYQNFSSSGSGAITIFSNRMGDIFILLSIALLTMNCSWNFSMNEMFPLIVLILLTLAACSKSAQFPFSAWLPAAMAAPTPISALVHSSTLVTAGVYLMIRVMNSPHPLSLSMILLISTVTTIYASMSANWEMDMKKIIALSTLSQIAMMMFAISLGSTILAYFHLIIHALFKSMMFLCAGIIIHSSSYQDMRFMGSMFKASPVISSILGIASLSLMGIPFMSGFFSKDPIIETILFSKFLSFLSILMLLSIGMTSAYSTRMVLFTLKFFLKTKPDINIHSSNFMETPIMLMAPFSILMGAIMMWFTSPNQLIIIPPLIKFLIIMILMLGGMLGISLIFASNKYKKFGQAAISLWFNHFLTTISFKLTSPLMNLFMKNDKLWQEMYGPKFCFKQISFYSSSPDLFMNQLLFIILLLTLFPLMIMFF